MHTRTTADTISTKFINFSSFFKKEKNIYYLIYEKGKQQLPASKLFIFIVRLRARFDMPSTTPPNEPSAPS